jgi:gas vesicle protein
MMSEYKGPDVKFLIGFFLGGIIGAITIFLIGTKEGKKTTRVLEKRGKDFIDELQEKIDDIEEQGKMLVKKGEELKEQVTEQLEEKKEVLSKETAVRVEKALAHIEELQEHGRDTTATIRKRFFKNIPRK